jgi:hypothetical protein
MRLPKTLAALSFLACLGTAPANAQSKQLVLKNGDNVLGSGTIRQFNKITVSDGGFYYAEVLTNDNNKQKDNVVVLNGFLAVLESTPVTEPAGASIAGFDDMDVNSQGFVGWPLRLQDTGSTSNDTGVYWNTLMLVQESGNVTATGFNGQAFGANTTYFKFFSAKINDRNSVLVSCEIQDPSQGGAQREQALVILKTDGAGTLVEEEFVAVQRFPFSTTGEDFGGLGQDVNNIGFNNNDGWIAILKAGSDLTADSMVVMNNQILAREGSLGPLPGRRYTDLGGSKIDLNDFDEYIFTAFLDGNTSNNVFLNVNGEVYAREGFTFPQIAPWNVDRFDAVPMYMANSGDAYWYVKTTDNATEDQFFFRNREVIIQENTTIVGGGAVNGLRTTQYSFHVSKSGRFWLAEIIPSGGGEALALADFGALVPIPGCSNTNPGSLVKTSGDARLGQTVKFDMDGEQGVGAVPLIWWSAAQSIPGQPCGLDTKNGEVLVSPLPANKVGQQTGAPSTGGPVEFVVQVPFDTSLVDLKAYGQGIWLDKNSQAGGPPVQLTNAYLFEIGL